MPPLLRVTFSGHKKVKRVFWALLLGRGYLGHIREKGGTGGIWEVSVRHLEASHLGGIWGQLGHLWRPLEASGTHLKASGRHLEASEEVWRHLGDIWRYLEDIQRYNLGDIWRHVGSWDSGRHLGGICRHLGDIWRHLGDIWRHLGASGGF